MLRVIGLGPLKTTMKYLSYIGRKHLLFCWEMYSGKKL